MSTLQWTRYSEKRTPFYPPSESFLSPSVRSSPPTGAEWCPGSDCLSPQSSVHGHFPTLPTQTATPSQSKESDREEGMWRGMENIKDLPKMLCVKEFLSHNKDIIMHRLAKLQPLCVMCTFISQN